MGNRLSNTLDTTPSLGKLDHEITLSQAASVLRIHDLTAYGHNSTTKCKTVG